MVARLEWWWAFVMASTERKLRRFQAATLISSLLFFLPLQCTYVGRYKFQTIKLMPCSGTPARSDRT